LLAEPNDALRSAKPNEFADDVAHNSALSESPLQEPRRVRTDFEEVTMLVRNNCLAKGNRRQYFMLDFNRMEVTLHIPDEVASKLSAGGDLTRRALEALALEGYREQTLTLYQVSEMLGLSRVETEDFLGQHHVPLSVITEQDLDREAALFEEASRRTR